MKKLLLIVAVLSLIISIPISAEAVIGALTPEMNVIINEPLPDWSVVDFSQFDDGFIETKGPLQVGGLVGEDISFSAGFPSSISLVPSFLKKTLVGNGSYDLGANGKWNADRNGFVALNAESGAMGFEFKDAVNGLGVFVNARGGEDVYTELLFGLTDNTWVVARPKFSFDENAINQGDFIALQRSAADIKRVYIGGYYPVVDDLKFSRTVVPEPMTIFLFGSGLMGVFIRKKFNA